MVTSYDSLEQFSRPFASHAFFHTQPATTGDVRSPYLNHDLLFLPISTIESAVGYSLITHCCVSRVACSRLNGHIEPHSPDFKREINTTTTVMNKVSNTTVYWNTLATLVYFIVDCGVTVLL